MLQQQATGRHEVRQLPQGGSAGSRALSASASPAPILLNDVQAALALGVSVRRFHTLRHEAWFPKPIVLGPRLLRWPRAELEAAVAAMPRQNEAKPEPAQLLRSRVERAKKTGRLS
ncbi:helix-turn-helix transcriptional regulator [Piscinibacter koreensis]|uniref:AlpA family phage regulatory protein n=1 Tax=Piscinibacter koreensis TaxID=2742824 RepID=A0A7Y6NQU4_9BURK|nr:hypothetical protein [Schlegelella koreensis]NUZ07647.1 hypothetical protein [Schlegelella koreensis]